MLAGLWSLRGPLGFQVMLFLNLLSTRQFTQVYRLLDDQQQVPVNSTFLRAPCIPLRLCTRHDVRPLGTLYSFRVALQ